MYHKLLTLFISLILAFIVNGQSCGISQNLTSIQESQIEIIIGKINIALQNEDLPQIDSLSNELKIIYDSQGGIPDAVESYYNLVNNSNWLSLEESILLSRVLISKDSMVYANLWKLAKGMKPPSDQPHSLFLRASAEIASGLLKIADKESDTNRKILYQSWATQALDTLATMQLTSGAFPFPDLRSYGDPTFGPIIQNFINACGADSVNVLQNGWIIDDKNSGEFKFDAGVIANSYYEAFLYTGNMNYKNIVIAIGNYLKPLKFNINYNYNTFVSLGLTRAYQLTNDTSYLNRAIKNIRFGVLPGQLINGRWLDGHNANSRYHSIIIQNLVPTINLISDQNTYMPEMNSMIYKAIENMLHYSKNCGSTTGYRWLLKSYLLSNQILTDTLKSKISEEIGKHINQSEINGKFLDIPTIGEYLELLKSNTPIANKGLRNNIEFKIYPNPSTDIINVSFDLLDTSEINLFLFDMHGHLLQMIDQGNKSANTYHYQVNLINQPMGIYFISLEINHKFTTHKIIKW